MVDSEKFTDPRQREILDRLAALEKHSHEPFDFTHLIERIELLETAFKAIHAGKIAEINAAIAEAKRVTVGLR